MTDSLIDVPLSDGDRHILAPADGCRVRKPGGALLVDAGEEVALDSYWRRRLADHDVRVVTPQTAASPQPAKPGAAA